MGPIYLCALEDFVNFAQNIRNMNTKNSTIRYRVIDRCLRQGGHSIAEIMAKVNRALLEKGLNPITSSNTIHNDIDAMSSYQGVTIQQLKKGRRVTWQYDDPRMSIFQFQFTDEQMSQLALCMSILSRFDGIPQMDWLRDFVEQFKPYLNLEDIDRTIVGFDECKYLRGRQHFARLHNAITSRQVLKIGYKTFSRDETRVHIFHPYYIKEHNRRWFVLGRIEGRDFLTTLAFDRIESIENAPGVEYKPENMDFEEDYFSDIVGVTRNKGEVEKVRIWVSPNLAPYISTKPLHESQIEKINPDGSMDVTLKVIPNFELRKLLLSHGAGLKVLAPASLAEEIKVVYRKGLELYDND